MAKFKVTVQFQNRETTHFIVAPDEDRAITAAKAAAVAASGVLRSSYRPNALSCQEVGR